MAIKSKGRFAQRYDVTAFECLSFDDARDGLWLRVCFVSRLILTTFYHDMNIVNQAHHSSNSLVM